MKSKPLPGQALLIGFDDPRGRVASPLDVQRWATRCKALVDAAENPHLRRFGKHVDIPASEILDAKLVKGGGA
jgi:hypothetical protein